MIERPVEQLGKALNIGAARRLSAAFAIGRQFFGADLVSAPAAEVLLRLYAAEIEGRYLTADDLASAIRLSSAVMLRWIAILLGRRLVELEDDVPLTIGAPLRITTTCEAALDDLFSRVGL